jgi:hypothetical protein
MCTFKKKEVYNNEGELVLTILEGTVYIESIKLRKCVSKDTKKIFNLVDFKFSINDEGEVKYLKKTMTEEYFKEYVSYCKDKIKLETGEDLLKFKWSFYKTYLNDLNETVKKFYINILDEYGNPIFLKSKSTISKEEYLKNLKF